MELLGTPLLRQWCEIKRRAAHIVQMDYSNIEIMGSNPGFESKSGSVKAGERGA
jgi:hypothetical protein